MRHRRKLENGAWTLTSELVGIWDILNYPPIWPSWYLPIQAQPFSHAVYAGPVWYGDQKLLRRNSLSVFRPASTSS